MNNKNIPLYVSKKQKHSNFRINLFVFILFFIFSISILVVFGFSLNKKLGLIKHNITISNLDKNLEGFTILHISDLNGDISAINSKELSDLLRGNNYSAVCLTGNMIGKKGDTQALYDLIDVLQSTNSQASIYFITGDSDPEPILLTPHGDTEVLANYIIDLQKLGLIYVDRPIMHAVGKAKLWFSPEYLYGIDAKTTLNAMTNEVKRMEDEGSQYEATGAAIYRSLSYKSRVMESTLEAISSMNEKDVQVVLSNTPLSENYIVASSNYSNSESLFSIKKSNLILSGYFVGGQWNLPNGTPIFVPDFGFFPPKEKVYGLSRLLTVSQYISPGLSTSDIYPYPKFRLFNQPSIALLKLTSKYK